MKRSPSTDTAVWREAAGQSGSREKSNKAASIHHLSTLRRRLPAQAHGTNSGGAEPIHLFIHLYHKSSPAAAE
jgi:hypothetical protein